MSGAAQPLLRRLARPLLACVMAGTAGLAAADGQKIGSGDTPFHGVGRGHANLLGADDEPAPAGLDCLVACARNGWIKGTTE